MDAIGNNDIELIKNAIILVIFIYLCNLKGTDKDTCIIYNEKQVLFKGCKHINDNFDFT